MLKGRRVDRGRHTVDASTRVDGRRVDALPLGSVYLSTCALRSGSRWAGRRDGRQRKAKRLVDGESATTFLSLRPKKPSLRRRPTHRCAPSMCSRTVMAAARRSRVLSERRAPGAFRARRELRHVRGVKLVREFSWLKRCADCAGASTRKGKRKTGVMGRLKRFP